VATRLAHQADVPGLARNYPVTRGAASKRKDLVMMVILLVFLLAVILAGLGFAVHLLWWIALIVLAIWLVGFLFRAAETAASPRRRWYRW
jgi:type IV secretory pathway TrbD component